MMNRHIATLIGKVRQLRSSGFPQMALALLNDLLSDFPDDPELLAETGQIEEQMGNHHMAVEHLLRASQSLPHRLDLRFTLGVALLMSGNPLAALRELGFVIHHAPDLPHSYRYRGLAYQAVGNHQEAFRDLQKAVSLDPTYAEGLGSLGAFHMTHGHFDEARALLARALEIKPDLDDVVNNTARLLLLSGRQQEATTLFARLCESLPPEHLHSRSNWLYSLLYRDDVTPEEITELHRRQFEGKGVSSLPHTLSPSPPFRVGYLSADFRTHSVSCFIEPILRCHDRRLFRVYCYSAVKGEGDDTTRRIRSLNREWRDISHLDTDSAAGLIRSDQLDILVDLGGHTADNRIDVLLQKPAQILVEWIGYPGTTGIPTIDWFIADPVTVPSGRENLFTERVARLPRVFSCYSSQFTDISPSPPPFLKNGHLTFGSFNNLAKVTHTTLQMFALVLWSVPGSRLILKSGSLSSTEVRNRLLSFFSSQGIDPRRIELRPHAPSPLEGIRQYADLDIALDTFPYNGTTTTCEALFMGVPVVTLRGESHHARVGASLLQSVGLSDLVTGSMDEYAETARRLAMDQQRLSTLRATLRETMLRSPLMDQAGVTRELETLYAWMIGVRRRGL